MHILFDIYKSNACKLKIGCGQAQSDIRLQVNGKVFRNLPSDKNPP